MQVADLFRYIIEIHRQRVANIIDISCDGCVCICSTALVDIEVSVCLIHRIV